MPLVQRSCDVVVKHSHAWVARNRYLDKFDVYTQVRVMYFLERLLLHTL